MNNLKLSDLKLGQEVIINGMLAVYQGIQKIKVSNFTKAEKIVFKAIGINMFKYYSLTDGTKTLASLKIEIINS